MRKWRKLQFYSGAATSYKNNSEASTPIFDTKILPSYSRCFSCTPSSHPLNSSLQLKTLRKETSTTNLGMQQTEIADIRNIKKVT